MRLARVLTRLNLGGPARQVLASDPLLMERGFELRVFTGESGPGEGDLTDELRAAGVDVRRVPGLGRTPAPLADLRALLHLRRELRAFAPHVVHTHASKAGLLGRLAARAVPGVRRVHTFHGHVLEGYFSPGRSRLVTRLEACLARGTDRVLAVSHATADDLLRLGVVAEERLTVAPPGVNLEELLALPRPRSVPGPGQAGGLRAELGLPEEAVLAGLVGRLAPVKQPLLALEAFLRAAKQAPDLHLVFVGDGPERSSLLAAQTALADSLRARVHLIGAITDRESVFSALDLVVLSSRSEGLYLAYQPRFGQELVAGPPRGEGRRRPQVRLRTQPAAKCPSLSRVDAPGVQPWLEFGTRPARPPMRETVFPHSSEFSFHLAGVRL